jgi:hypothetical protein
MPDPFTIRIFVPDGDPEGLRIIDRMNWTGQGIVFPREEWMKIRHRSEFSRVRAMSHAHDSLVRNEDVLKPARVLEACRTAQAEFLIGGPIDVADDPQPEPAPRSPLRRRRA